MDTATPIGRAATGAVRKRSLGAGCIEPTSGRLTCGRRSCCASRSAVNALGKADGSARRMWTTSSTTRETGKGSAIGAILKAYATAATAAKRRENCTKIAPKHDAAGLRRGGRLGRSGASRERRAGLPCDPSPGSESFRAAAKNREPPLVRDFFPTGNFRKASACSPLFDRGGHEFPPTPRPSNCEGRGMRRSAAGGGESD